MSNENAAETQPPEIQSKQKPVMEPAMAAWLVQKLDCPVVLENHEERNKFAACVNQLVAIANWKEEG